MMRRFRTALVAAPVFIAACTSSPDKHTLAELRGVSADTTDVRVEDGLETAMQSYRRFLDETPESAMTAEAMRRLADLKIEKEYGILGDGAPVEMPAPDAGTTADARAALLTRRKPINNAQPKSSSEEDLERRATEQHLLTAGDHTLDEVLPDARGADLKQTAPAEAIALYDQLLEKYPSYEHNDQVLYQKARAYDELGRTDEAMVTIERLIAAYPQSKYLDEVQFRRGENFFVRRKYRDAERAYAGITTRGAHSDYYELALYKLGWALYKQDLYDEALHNYVALLDYKVSVGYDFDQKHEEEDERRISDTFDVISLSFSNLGGPQIVREYFAERGHRGYEDRVYRNLGEFYRGKLRYQDAASAYQTFVSLYPFHKSAPHFSMREIEIYEEGSFPKLVLESKKAFASQYGLQAEYWRHFDVHQSPEVLAYLKRNLTDLANHYHAQYQDKALEKEKPANYAEATRWYREFLTSFGKEAEAPPINYQLADLMLENRDFAGAAKEYERTAYEYPPHEKASAAGYAAIYAHRETLKVSPDDETARRSTVASSLKFAETFPDHEHAAVVLGAAADDLYEMKDVILARESARKLIERYPNAAPPVRRSAWIVVAHSSFDLADYPNAEQAYTRVLVMTSEDEQSRLALVENLAASIYKQGEQANQIQDYRAAADHFLRIKQAAPTAAIRASAEYDAGAALANLKDWAAAAEVFDAFRRTYPEHKLQHDATKQIALIYRESGQVSRAADEYERVATESEDPQLRSEALLLAGDLYEQSDKPERALNVYAKYVEQFPRPIELAVETRFKMAGIHKKRHADAEYKRELQAIIDSDAGAGAERTGRTRYLAARASLTLSEELYQRFAEVKLLQPFEKSLQEKQKRMDAALQSFTALVGYEDGEVTAAATYYMAEIYSGFNHALVDSERPVSLAGAEKQEYESALEEEAFPFEEKAIAVHEKNLELMTGGVYNAWVEKSLGRLAQLKPGRYAKSEISSGFLGSVDRYAYRRPGAPATIAQGATNAVVR